ncbi:MAG: efflux RND transporter permease subunit [Firmicutes bacterium]|nr:efflux RND transporter permease subunit [Bacillota bacterium]
MLSKFSVKRPYTVVVAVLVVLILGIVAFMGMQVDLMPSINLPYSVVVTTYAGASPEEVETVITEPLEQAMATVSNIKNIMSISSENMSLVILEFNQNTEMSVAANEMREKIDLVKPYWSDDERISTPMIMQINPDMMPVVIASVDVEGKDAEELSAFIDKSILPRLESVEGVAAVTAIGMLENRINVTIDEKLVDEINDVIAAAIDGDISKAKAMLASARAEIEAGYQQLEAAKAQGEAELNAAQSQLDAGKEALKGTKSKLEQAVAGLEQQKSALEGAVSSLKGEKASLEAQIKAYTDQGTAAPEQLTSALAGVEKELAAQQGALAEVEKNLAASKAGLEEVNAQSALLDGQQAELDKGRQQMENEFNTAKYQLDAGMEQINSGSAQISSAASQAKSSANINNYITKEMISGILMAQNFSMPAGTIDAVEGSFSVKVGDDLNSLEDIENLLLFELGIAGVDDIRIKDVAYVDYAKPETDTYTKINGNNGILLSFEKQSNYSTSEVSDNINAVMADLQEDYEGVSYFPFMDQGEYVHDIINSVMENLLLGAILAILILIVFLKDYRPTLIIAVSIPASLLFALVMMYFTGISMNLISMSGLALGVGMLVDNSIVVIENIYRLRREGMPSMKAAVYGAKQVSGAIIASTLTTISVFVPIAFTNGMSKELFIDMGLTIGFSLIASLIVALTVVPSMASRVLRKDNNKEQRFIGTLHQKYDGWIRWILDHKKVTIIAVCVLLVGSIVLSFSRGFSFMPSFESTELTATLSTEDEEMTLDDFYAAADAVTEKALSIEGVDAIGAMSTGSGSAMSMMSGGEDKSITMYMTLDPKQPAKGEEIRDLLTETAESYGCEIAVTTSTDVMALLGGSGISMTVKGESLEELASFTKDLGNDLKSIEGVGEVISDMENPSAQLMITVDKDAAMKKGLTVAQVYQTVAAEVAADTAATKMMLDGSEYSIYVLDNSETQISIDDIAAIEVAGQNGSAVVGDIAEITEEDSPASIYRMNQQRYMTVTAMVEEGAVASKVTSEVQDYMKDYELPEGITVDVGGESVTVQGYMEDLFLAIFVALILMYLIMVAQFQSLRAPFIVMFTVPLAFTGGFLALFLLGFDVSVVALLGCLVLCGIIVNNGIVLVDYINRLIADGMGLREAIVLGGKTRMRPIMMTALTTILAMLPMAFAIGEGMEMIQPMAIVTIGGLVYATIMTLFFVPAMYEIFYKKRVAAGKIMLSDAAFDAMLEAEMNEELPQAERDDLSEVEHD